MRPRSCLYLIAASLLLAATARAAEGPAKRLITVAGQAEVQVVPDEVVFKLETESVARDLSEAKTANDASVRKVFELARDYGVAPQYMQTEYISISRRYEDMPDANRKRVFIGYAVSQNITVLLKDVSRFEGLFSDLLKAGVSDVSDVTFRSSQMRKYMDQARALAIKAAREKALAMSSQLGQRVGRPDSITEIGMNVFSAYGEEDSHAPSNNYSTEMSSNGVSDNGGTFAPGMISISARVRVSFELY